MLVFLLLSTLFSSCFEDEECIFQTIGFSSKEGVILKKNNDLRRTNVTANINTMFKLIGANVSLDNIESYEKYLQDSLNVSVKFTDEYVRKHDGYVNNICGLIAYKSLSDDSKHIDSLVYSLIIEYIEFNTSYSAREELNNTTINVKSPGKFKKTAEQIHRNDSFILFEFPNGLQPDSIYVVPKVDFNSEIGIKTGKIILKSQSGAIKINIVYESEIFTSTLIPKDSNLITKSQFKK